MSFYSYPKPQKSLAFPMVLQGFTRIWNFYGYPKTPILGTFLPVRQKLSLYGRLGQIPSRNFYSRTKAPFPRTFLREVTVHLGPAKSMYTPRAEACEVSMTRKGHFQTASASDQPNKPGQGPETRHNSDSGEPEEGSRVMIPRTPGPDSHRGGHG